MNASRHPLSLWVGYHSGLEFGYDSAVSKCFLDYKEQRHKALSACLVRTGRIELFSDNDHAVALPGQWLICTGDKTSQTIAEGTHLLSLRMHIEWPIEPTFSRGSTLRVLEASDCPGLETKALDLLRSVCNATSSGQFLLTPNWENDFSFHEYLLYQQYLHTWTSELFTVLRGAGEESNQQTAIDPRLEKIISFLRHHPMSAPFPKEALQRISGVQIKRLNKICSDTLGFTLHSLWDQQRYSYAQRALRFPYLTIKEIASTLGFNRLQHFSGWFRTHRGLSPRAFRQTLHNSSDAVQGE